MSFLPDRDRVRSLFSRLFFRLEPAGQAVRSLFTRLLFRLEPAGQAVRSLFTRLLFRLEPTGQAVRSLFTRLLFRLEPTGQAVRSIWKRALLLAALFALIPFCSAAVTEIINQQSFSAFADWLPNSGGYFFGSAFFFFGLLMLFSGITGSLAAATAVSLIPVLLFDIGSFCKMAARNEPLYFGDFRYIGGIGDLTGSTNIVFSSSYVYAIVFIVLAVTALAVIRPLRKAGWMPRVTMAAVGIGLLCFFCLSDTFVSNEVKDYSYTRKGFVVGLSSNIKKNLLGERVEFVDADSAESMMEVIDGLKEQLPPTTAANTSSEKPNVIIVMSESFFDITRLPGLELSEDPIPNFRALGTSGTAGMMRSTTYGGGTSSVE